MRRLVGLWVLPIALAAAVPVASQTAPPLPQAAVAPINVILPNYNGVGVGEIGSLEANAFLARADDASAAWYNPAALTLAKQSSVSGSAGAFQTVFVDPQNLPRRGTSFQQIPSLVSFTIKNLFGSAKWAGGFSLARSFAWSQSVDGQRTFTTPTASERVMYSSLGEMSGWTLNLGVGHASSGKWRIGGSLDGQLTQTTRNQTVSDQYQTASGLGATEIQAHGYAWTWHFRMSVGAQYDVRPGVRVGAVMRTPGVQIFSGGSFNHEGLSKVGATTTTASFFDPEPSTHYKLPFEFKAGATWIRSRAQVEVDLLTYAGGGSYEAFQTTQPWTIITDSGTGGAATVQQRPFDVSMVDSRAVVNVAVGGQVQLTSSGSWKLHAGYATDRSPVGPNDTSFTKVHMQAVTIGVSARMSFLLGSVGVRYASGLSGDVPLRQLQDGQTLTTTLKVSTIGMVYSVSLRF
jgi:hypothetical protein